MLQILNLVFFYVVYNYREKSALIFILSLKMLYENQKNALQFTTLTFSLNI